MPFAKALPGLVLALALALAARLAHGLLPPRAGQIVGEVLVAVLFGLAVGNLLSLGERFAPGLKYSVQTVLRLAIVLLGASLSLAEVGRVGGRVLLLIVALMALALVLAHTVGRWVGTPPRLASLIGVGTAICGNSAISATAPVIGALDEEMSFAIATNTLFGTLAVLVYPLVGQALGLSDGVFGIWSGTAVNDTSQVVAASFAFSEAAGKMATTVKLTRNALMGAVIVLMGWLHGGASEAGAPRASVLTRLRQSFPTFVLGFLALATLRSVGAFDAASAALGTDLPKLLTTVARFLILVALAAVGATTRVAQLRKIGLAPFWLGFAVATATSVASLGAASWLMGSQAAP
ncbi:MAG TPA: putative sulfate exporter family transporter [Thermoanaerobaculia bacterium]|nr:putative sulfate exporter family transporter [Thermoanaerobaculia bacterium]